MNALVQRIERIVGTVRDPISYRLLWCGLTNRLVSIPGGNFDSGAPANSGWPMDAPSRNSDRIPRIIFQPWTSRHALPANYAYWRQSFVANNPGYKFFFWDDSDNRRFIAEWFPWFLARFDSYPREIFRTNITRLFFLYAHGGFSVHMDSECLKPLDEFGGDPDVVVGRMGRDSTFEHSIPNAIMASKPNQALWLLTIAIGLERLTQSQTRADVEPEWLTGPVLLKDAVDFYLAHSGSAIAARISKSCPELALAATTCDFGRVSIMPSKIWCPINWNNVASAFFQRKMVEKKAVLDRSYAGRLFPGSFIVTYWSTPWN
jgi:mannosyltransferase OCH1-like enzyme